MPGDKRPLKKFNRKIDIMQQTRYGLRGVSFDAIAGRPLGWGQAVDIEKKEAS
jgi:hypothetical protein